MAKRVDPKKYIKRPGETVTVILRIEEGLKEQMRSEAIRLNTSMTQLIEASIRCYLDKLDK